MKLFLNDFSMSNNLNTHLTRVWLCFNKCKKNGINLNPKKCMFLVHSGVILGYVVSKEGKLSDLKKIRLLSTCLPQKHLKTFGFSMAWPNTSCISSRILFSLWLPLPSYYGRQKLLNGQWSVNKLGKTPSSTTWMHRFWFHLIGNLSFMFTQTVLI
jgi:hypothetical protein